MTTTTQQTNPLAFWAGRWTVQDATTGKLVGTSVITAELDGNAVVERWHGAGGLDGLSLFWFDRIAGTWRQAWATSLGYAKQKQQVQVDDPLSIRFLGLVTTPDAVVVRDRTTLTDLQDGRVRQVIETAPVDRDAWDTGFDAIYVPRGE
ncbi:MAG TPA: hypothetical protein VI408_07545 [Gaiellaceae bacterium]